MLKNKSYRHTLAFMTITCASGLLIPVLQAGLNPIIWIIFGIIILANLINLLIT